MNTMVMRILQLAVLMGGMIVAGNNHIVQASFCPECSENQVACCGVHCGVCCTIIGACGNDICQCG